MRTNYPSVLVVALLLGLITPQLSAAGWRGARSQGEGIVGVWWGEAKVLPGQPISFIVAHHADGTSFLRTSVDNLRSRPFDLDFSQGIRERNPGRHSARVPFLRYTLDQETREVIGLDRMRVTIEQDKDDPDRISGTFSIETLPCPRATPESNPDCPNPTDDITGFSPPIVQDVPYTVTWVRFPEPADAGDTDGDDD